VTSAQDVAFFKQEFHTEIETAVAHTPLDLDMITAIACQETGHIWQTLRRKQLSVDRILALCVGDTLDDTGGRRVFPRNKAELVAAPRGAEMFAIARQGLVDMAQHVPGFQSVAAKPNKFCHGFGIFQLDLQFFRQEPDYFLEKRYARFEETLKRCIEELQQAMKRIHFDDKTSLTDFEMACVAIAYNTGGFKPSKGLKQGHFDGTKFYGEAVFDFLRLSRTVATPGGAPAAMPAAPPGNAVVPPPTPVEATGPFFVVDTQVSLLRLRREPTITKTKPTANVVGELPDGQVVRAITGEPVKGFLEVETSLSGAHLRGFAAAKFLKPAPAAAAIPIVTPATTPPTSGIVAVFMPRKPGTVTKRTEIAGAHSLNEPNMPGRKGTTPDELRTELAAIIDFLAVDKAAHKRYRPRSGMTFCNIYAHDYCFLAGVYLPRVWWTPSAIIALTQGKTVEPLIGDTIEEQRANDLFRWLRDFGPSFGWRQTGTLSKLQQGADQGAIGLIVARRKQDGLSGHIVAVVPETDDERARRNAAGDVIAPHQSQAGAVNFRYGTGRVDWWKGNTFAESAFWLHS
jgi:hypothetical protein